MNPAVGSRALGLWADAAWRAAAYCLHPKVVLWSLLPLALSISAAIGLGWLYWESATAAVRQGLETWSLLAPLFQWLEALGATDLRAVIAPIVVVAVAMPLLVVLSLLLVALLMTPALVRLVEQRRFAGLERRGRNALWRGLLWSVAHTAAALLMLALTLPLWLLPPLGLLVPPLIWGWLAMRVMAFDVLADHAEPAEREALLKQHRLPLWAIGLVTGLLGAAPTLVWAVGALTFILAPFLVAVSMWLYTLVFAFSSLWFAHYLLAALQGLRHQVPPHPPASPPRALAAASSLPPSRSSPTP